MVVTHIDAINHEASRTYDVSELRILNDRVIAFESEADKAETELRSADADADFRSVIARQRKTQGALAIAKAVANERSILLHNKSAEKKMQAYIQGL